MFQYEELNKQYIGGKWQEGSSPNVLENKNPYTQKTFTTFRKATADDVDEAYRQRRWRRKNGMRSIRSKKIHFRKSRHVYRRKRRSHHLFDYGRAWRNKAQSSL